VFLDIGILVNHLVYCDGNAITKSWASIRSANELGPS